MTRYRFLLNSNNPMRLSFVFLLVTALFLATLWYRPLWWLNGCTSGQGLVVTSDVAYGQDVRQQLDVYRPMQTVSTHDQHWPVVVFFYGGSWNRGARQDYQFVGRQLAKRGMVVVIADYRLYPQVRYPDFLLDCATAVAWVQKHISQYGGDANQLYLMGHSAGAYNAAMLSLDQRWLATQAVSLTQIKGWIGLAGPYDFFPIKDQDVQPVFRYPDYPPDSQPIEYADVEKISDSASVKHVFLAIAQHDQFVDPERNTVQLAEKLKRLGISVRLMRYADVNHATLIGAMASPLTWLAPVLDDITDFVLKTP